MPVQTGGPVFRQVTFEHCTGIIAGLSVFVVPVWFRLWRFVLPVHVCEDQSLAWIQWMQIEINQNGGKVHVRFYE